MMTHDTTKRHFITKCVSNNMGSGLKLVQWRFRYRGNYPFCRHANEDVPHLLSCIDSKALRIWNKSLWDYITKLHKLQACNSATVVIMRELQVWREDLQLLPLDHLSEELATAIRQQRSIGWKQFLEGLIA
jgi:retron-type reverse transcriptase